MKTSGFTLIELMVVIAIIGILASTVISNLSNAKASARDVLRVQDMKTIHIAFELFFNDNGHYPDVDQTGISDSGEMLGVGNPIDVALSPYLDPIPKDPLHDGGTGLTPVGGALYFYGYDPTHAVSLEECLPNFGGPPWPTSGVEVHPVFGFNKAEIGGEVRRDTCWGSNVNLDDADYNFSLSSSFRRLEN